ncbi:MAG: bacillithiol system redox-active protein YtxJ [Planctomycetes bacterium]|nr:bacillithiol system redox-active protein YtxJ [Planctomycetota bacterium]
MNTLLPLDSLETLEHLLGAKERVVFFKHSTRCPVSTSAEERVSDYVRQHGAVIHLVDVLRSRPLSNLLAERLRVRHESPQLLIVQNGRCLAHASHDGIDEAFLAQQLG